MEGTTSAKPVGNKKPAPVTELYNRNRLNKLNRNTFAARYNRTCMDALQKALRKNPEADIFDLLTPKYTVDLKKHKQHQARTRPLPHPHPEPDERNRIHWGSGITVLRPFSAELQALVESKMSDDYSDAGSTSSGICTEDAQGTTGLDSGQVLPQEDETDQPESDDQEEEGREGESESESESESDYRLGKALVVVLDAGDVLDCAAARTIIRISENLVAKMGMEEFSAINEFESLAYLAANHDNFPAPKPHGVVRWGRQAIIFSSYVPGITLEKAWPSLGEDQQHSVHGQLNSILSAMRALPFPDDGSVPLGNVEGRGCLDLRNQIGIRRSPRAINSVREFQDWCFADLQYSSQIYTQFLKSMQARLQTNPVKCVFSHADFRPANIIVTVDTARVCTVVGIVDWEFSGFYPEYWDALKSTNNLVPSARLEWFLQVPECISPLRYQEQWLLDRILDNQM